MAWHAQLHLNYRLDGGRTVGHDVHSGPLRVLKALRLPGSDRLEHVLVHPPGGLAGGDVLDLQVQLQPGAQVRLTTPSATRFYRSLGDWAEQRVRLHLQPGSFLEWLPLETLVHGGSLGRSRWQAHLDPGAALLGWDAVCLGLPAAGDAFEQGCWEQRMTVEGVWQEAARVEASDVRLRQSSLGLQGQPVWASLWCAWGEPQAALAGRCTEAAREALRPWDDSPAGPMGGLRCAVTSPHARLVVVRALAPRVEPVFEAWRAVRRAWWPLLQATEPFSEPRIWAL